MRRWLQLALLLTTMGPLGAVLALATGPVPASAQAQTPQQPGLYASNPLITSSAPGAPFGAGAPGAVSVVWSAPSSDATQWLVVVRNNTDQTFNTINVTSRIEQSGKPTVSGRSIGAAPVIVPPGGIQIAVVRFDGRVSLPDGIRPQFNVTSATMDAAQAHRELRILGVIMNGNSATIRYAFDAPSTDMIGATGTIIMCFDGPSSGPLTVGAFQTSSILMTTPVMGGMEARLTVSLPKPCSGRILAAVVGEA